jgi:hypothetical protein
MRNEVKAFKQRSHLIVIVPLIETQALRACVTRTGTFDRNTLNGLSGDLEIVFVSAFYYASDGDASALGQKTAFYALFGTVSGIGASFFPTRGALLIAPSIEQKRQLMPFNSS